MSPLHCFINLFPRVTSCDNDDTSQTVYTSQINEPPRMSLDTLNVLKQSIVSFDILFICLSGYCLSQQYNKSFNPQEISLSCFYTERGTVVLICLLKEIWYLFVAKTWLKLKLIYSTDWAQWGDLSKLAFLSPSLARSGGYSAPKVEDCRLAFPTIDSSTNVYDSYVLLSLLPFILISGIRDESLYWQFDRLFPYFVLF